MIIEDKKIPVLGQLKSKGILIEWIDDSVYVTANSDQWNSGLRDILSEYDYEISKELAESVIESSDLVVCEEIGPVSPSQERLLNVERLLPQSILYQQPETLFMYGQLNIEALKYSINEVINHQGSLRTVFRNLKEKNRYPIQIVNQFEKRDLEFIDLSKVDNPKDDLYSIIWKKSHLKFSLRKGPLFRFSVVKLDEEEHIFMFSIHHLISDGWSSELVLKQLSHYYNAKINNTTPSISPLEITFSSYCKTLQEKSYIEALKKSINYWKKELEGPYKPIQFSPKNRVDALSLKIVVHKIKIEAALIKKIEKESSLLAITVPSVLLGVFALVLHKTFKSDDIRIGTMFANRMSKKIEKTVGFLANMLIIRFLINNNLNHTDWLKSCNKKLQNAMSNQEIPFQEVVAALESQDAYNLKDLLQVKFVITNVSKEPIKFEGLKHELKNLIDGTQIGITSMDLRVHLVPQQNGDYSGTISYKKGLFSEAQIHELWNTYLKLLQEVF